MIYASEILEAVKRGGSENWTTSKSDVKGRDKPLSKNQRRTEEAMADLFNAMGNNTCTVKELSAKTGMKLETVNKYLLLLIGKNRVKRSIIKQPYQYKKI